MQSSKNNKQQSGMQNQNIISLLKKLSAGIIAILMVGVIVYSVLFVVMIIM